MCESRNSGKRFTCNWLRQILVIPTEEQKSNFIKESIKDAWSSMSNACQMQWSPAYKCLGVYLSFWVFDIFCIFYPNSR